MAQIAFKGNPIHTCGQLPAVGSPAPDFKLTGTDLADVTLATFAGKRVILNIFPSVDTAVCAMSVRRFNAEAAKLDNTVVLCVSLDLPFAHKRFCGAEGLSSVHSVSEMRERGFGEAYGVRMVDGPLAGLLGRAVVIIDGTGKVIYTQLVPEIVEEPNYEQALAALA
ncbi:MAG: thiol peroxidase [Magnetococcales bacterium]|nr:thiol peroxidase [Magnetococcales bacterium]